MGTLHRFRKAYGAIKDSTKVGLAKVNSDFKDLDIAIVKATNHVECPPKERYIRKIFAATSVAQPRADVAYCIHTLSRRLAKTHSWIVALKTLIVIHRTLRDGDPTFREELLNFAHKGHVFQVSNFKDDSSPLAWDCSAWIRAYALFLEERLECFRTLKYDIEGDRLIKTGPGMSKVHSRAQMFTSEELLDQLPILQQLMSRLTGCQPEGGAYHNYLVQYALALVLKESFKIYCAINDGIIKLVDMFFDMSKPDAIKALNIYKRACQQADNLANFYDFCKGLDLARNFQFPILRQPPSSFLATMEDYIKEAPQIGSASSRRLEYHDVEEEEQPEEEPTPQATKELEEEKEEDEEEQKKDMKEEPQSKDEDEVPPLIATTETNDLLGFNEVNPQAKALEESNALALAIVQPGNDTLSRNNGLDEIGKTSGWELALVTTPSTSTSSATQSKLGGGFDKLLLDSLYEDNGARRHIQLHQAGYNSNYGSGYEMMSENNTNTTLYGHTDPFQMSNNIAPPTNVQMAMLENHQQTMMWHHQQQQQQHNMNMMVPYQNPSSPYITQQQQYPQQNMLPMVPHPVQTQYYQQQQQPPTSFMQSSNPFGDPFTFPQTTMPQHGNRTLL